MKVKLINCLKIFRDSFPPYGLGIINAFLNNHSIKSDIFDLDIVVKYHNSLGKRSSAVNLDYLKRNYDSIYRILKLKKFNFYLDLQFEKMLKKINLNDVDVVGLNSHDNEIYTSLYLAKKIKEKRGCTVVIGGSHIKRISYDRLKYFIENLNINYVDYFVKIKPDAFFLRLDKNKAYNTMGKPEIFPGEESAKISSDKKSDYDDSFKYFDFGIPMYNKEHLELYKIDMKKIKFFYPKFNNLLLNKFENLHDSKPILILPYVFMRGCTHNCAFCFAGLQKPFKLDIETVLSGIKAMKEEYKCDNFYFLNNNLVMDKEYAIKLFKKMSDEVNIRWSDASSIKGLDYKMLKLMSDSGCIQLLFGLESASQKILKYVHKNVNYNKIEYYTNCFKNCDKNNIWVVVDMILGFPYETQEDIERSVKYLDENKNLINGVFPLSFTMYDNSVMFTNPKKYGLEIADDKLIRERTASVFGKDADVYRKIYYRTFPFNELETGLSWESKQNQIKRTYMNFNRYLSRTFKTKIYVHYPIFFLYDMFDGNKKDIMKFLAS